MENGFDAKSNVWSSLMRQKLTEIHYSASLNPVMECVYALEMSNDTVKIGKTKNFESRMRTIASSSGLEVTNYFHTEYVNSEIAGKIERACHSTFSAHRTKGEFFNINFDEACRELEKYKDEIAEANRKFYEEEQPAIRKKYDEYLNSPDRITFETVRNNDDWDSIACGHLLYDFFKSVDILEKGFGATTDSAFLAIVNIYERNGVDLTAMKKVITSAYNALNHNNNQD